MATVPAVKRCDNCGQATAGDCGQIAFELLNGAQVMLMGMPDSVDRDEAVTHLIITLAALRRARE
jgi:hypothetical protein